MTEKGGSDLSGLPAPPWRRSKPRPRPVMTQEAIVAAAMEVLDEVGMDGLSMRRVAARLGTGAASLYWHVRNKDELLQLLFERAVSDVELPPADPTKWKEQLKALGYQMRDVLRSHRDIARISLGRVPTGPQVLALTEWLFTLLQPVGVPDRVIAYLGDFAGLYVGAYCFEESLGLASPTGEPLPPGQIVEMIKDYMRSLPADRFPRAIAALDLVFDSEYDQRFDFGLELLVSGVERYAGTAPAAP